MEDTKEPMKAVENEGAEDHTNATDTSPIPQQPLGMHAHLRASLQSLTASSLHANRLSLRHAEALNSLVSLGTGSLRSAMEPPVTGLEQQEPEAQQKERNRDDAEETNKEQTQGTKNQDKDQEQPARASLPQKTLADKKMREMVPSLVVDQEDDDLESDLASISRTSPAAPTNDPPRAASLVSNSLLIAPRADTGPARYLDDSDATPSDATPPPPAIEYRTYRRRWIGLAGLAVLNLLVSWGWLSFAAISSTTAAWFGLASEAPVNWLSTAILFAYLASAPLVAPLLHARGVRGAMLVCAGLMVAGNWVRYAGTAVQKFGATMTGQILIGLAQPFALSAATHYTDLWFTSRSRVSANAIISVANPLGGAVAQLVGPPVVGDSPANLKTFVLITAIVASAGAAVTAVAPGHPPSPPCASAAAPKLGLRASLKTLLRSPAFVVALCMFSIYVGLFNAYSTFINQIMEPYGYSADEAGYTGALLIVAGLVGVGVVSPIVDRTHWYLPLFYVCLPVIAGCFVSLQYTATRDTQLAGPFVVSGVLGACSFSLLPTILEWVQEQTAPVSPSVACTLLWCGGQLMGGVFIIAMDSLKYAPAEGDPPGNMRRALVFQAVWGCVGVVPLFFLRAIARPNSRVVLDRGSLPPGAVVDGAEGALGFEADARLESRRSDLDVMSVSVDASSIEVPLEHVYADSGLKK